MRRLELKRVEWTRPVTMINISYKGNNLHPDKKNMFLFFFTSTCHNAMVKFYILTKRIFFCSLVLKIRSVNQQQLWNCHCPNLSRDLNTPINQSFYVMRGSFCKVFLAKVFSLYFPQAFNVIALVNRRAEYEWKASFGPTTCHYCQYSGKKWLFFHGILTYFWHFS